MRHKQVHQQNGLVFTIGAQIPHLHLLTAFIVQHEENICREIYKWTKLKVQKGRLRC